MATTTDLEKFVDGRIEDKLKALDERVSKQIGESLAKGIPAAQAEVERKYADIFMKAREDEFKRGKKERPVSLIFGKMMRMKALSESPSLRQRGLDTLALARKIVDNDPEVKGYLDVMTKANIMDGTTPTAGEFLIPAVMGPEVIELLYAHTVMDKVGVRKYPMENGNLELPRVDTGATVAYSGETSKGTPTNQVLGRIKLSAKKINGFIVMSNSLLRSSSFNADQIFVTDLQRQFALKVDYTQLYGTGTEYVPRGIANFPGIQTAGSSSTAFPVTQPGDLVALLETANVLGLNNAWIMHPMMKNYIMNLTFNSMFAFRDEMTRDKTLFGIPFFTSTQVGFTNNATPGLRYGDIFLADFSEFAWGEQLAPSIRVSQEATVTVNSTAVNTFEQDLTVTQILAEHDFQLRHPAAFVKGTYKFASS